MVGELNAFSKDLWKVETPLTWRNMLPVSGMLFPDVQRLIKSLPEVNIYVSKSSSSTEFYGWQELDFQGVKTTAIISALEGTPKRGMLSVQRKWIVKLLHFCMLRK